MKQVLTILFIFLYGFSFRHPAATTYFISNSGSTSNNGTSASTPWPFSKVNSTAFAAGDIVLLNKGEVFQGTLVISHSGTLGNPITYGAYGTGASPLINGFTNVNAWTNLGGNIWESSGAYPLATCNMVSLNGVNAPMGRFPQSGWLLYTAPTASTITGPASFTSGTTDWTGAQAVIRKNDFAMDRCSVTGHSGQVLTFTSLGGGSAPTKNYGFFIQNDARTLTYQDAWFYTPAKKLRIYSTVSPVNVQMATSANVLTDAGFDYITIDGISFTGSNADALSFAGSSNNITLQNCTISFSGLNGINMNGNNDVINNNIVSNSGGAGIIKAGAGGSSITNNTITNSGIIAGQSFTTNLNRGIFVQENPGPLVQYNVVQNTGAHGISTSSNVSRIRILNNYVDSAVRLLNDNGAIYLSGDSVGRVIDANIITNCIGNTAGTPAINLAEGIYLDELAAHVKVTNNSISNCGEAGIKMHKANTDTINYNTVYNSIGITLQDDVTGVIHDNIMMGNIFVTKAPVQYVTYYRSNNNDLTTFFTKSDSNYFCRPINDSLVSNLTFKTYEETTMYVYRSLKMWQTFSGKSLNSHISPRFVTNVNQLDYEFNPTQSVAVKTLPPGNWVDVKNAPYSGTVTLAPYSSVALINIGAATNIAPTASAGPDQTIQLPASGVTLSGSGSDSDGIISKYGWTQVSGTGGTITTPAGATTTITGLGQGVYQYKLTVTDNSGATGTDIVVITVTAANIAPTASAGSDQAIQLPASSVSLSGSGTDPDGTIVSYGWTNVSGPNTPTITSAATAATSVSGLVEGTYLFQLKVTDNQTLTGIDQVQVIVSASPNVAPTATAGTDQTIQLPVNSVTLTGSGTDPDGTIASYKWTQIAGATATITTSLAATTTVTGLTTGTSQFKLTVTDNGGLTGSATIIITVTPANVPPLVNAGTDQSITLPDSTVSLSGTVSDPDGTITGHTWTKISGSGGIITTPSSLTTTVTGLTSGTYVFSLTGTDNQGLTGFDQMSVIVNPAGNIAPVANSGADQVITWPLDSLIITGSGTDSDGSIVAYNWTKISGPATGSITSPAAASTTLAGLVVGIYQYQLQVTDNSGATAKDTMQLSVVKGSASLSFINLGQTWSGLALSPGIVTTPAGLSTSLTLDGLTGGKTDAGSYSAAAGITDPNWNFTPITGTFTIAKLTVAINAVSATYNFDGLTHFSVATTTPDATGITYLFDGTTASPPSAIGAHSEHITLVNASTQATPVDVTVTIVSNAAAIFISDTLFAYTTTPHTVKVTSAYSYTLTGAPQTNAGTYPVSAVINDGIHTGSSSATLTITKGVYQLSWFTPAPVAQGSKLTTGILNAVSTIAGTITYSLPLGTTLNTPGTLNLVATFHPADAGNYDSKTISVSLIVYGSPFLNFWINYGQTIYQNILPQ